MYNRTKELNIQGRRCVVLAQTCSVRDMYMRISKFGLRLTSLPSKTNRMQVLLPRGDYLGLSSPMRDVGQYFMSL